MPTFRHGKSTYFGLATSNASDTIVAISTVLRSVGFPRTIDMAETTAFGSSVKTFVPGITAATFTIQGMFDATTMTQIEQFIGTTGLTGAGPAFSYGPEGSTASQVKYTGFALLSAVNITGSVADMVQANVDFQINSAITRTTF